MNICPHCGYDLAQDRIVSVNGLTLNPRGAVYWHGEYIHLSTQQRMILNALVKANSGWLTHATIADRLGYTGDRPSPLVNVGISRLRAKLPGAPIESSRVLGFRWRQH